MGSEIIAWGRDLGTNVSPQYVSLGQMGNLGGMGDMGNMGFDGLGTIIFTNHSFGALPWTIFFCLFEAFSLFEGILKFQMTR